MKESFDRLKENAHRATRLDSKNIVPPASGGIEAGREMYHRFYGKKQP